MNFQQQQEHLQRITKSKHQRILKKLEKEEPLFSPKQTKVQNWFQSDSPKIVNLEKKIKKNIKNSRSQTNQASIISQRLTNQLFQEAEDIDSNDDLVEFIVNKNQQYYQQPKICYTQKPKTFHPYQEELLQQQQDQVYELDQNYVINFVKEFQKVHKQGTDDFQIQMLQMREIMEKLHFLGKDNTQQEQLFFQAWRMICNDQHQDVQSNDLLIFLFAIQNLNTSKLIKSQTLDLTDDQVVDIHQFYISLYQNYIKSKNNQQFQPKINDKSRQLARARKEKILDSFDGQNYYKIKKENDLQIQQKMKLEKEMQECTFQPNIKNKNQVQSKYKQINPQNKPINQINFEKNMHEYTFQPNISKPEYKQDRIDFQNMNQVQNIINAREKQQVDKILKESGDTYNQQREKKIQNHLRSTSFSISKQNQKPILVLDVMMKNNQTSQVHLYEGDEVDQIAKQFGQKYNLDDETTQRLELALHQQLYLIKQ